jgi:acyl-CoA thioesterase-1
MMMIKQTAGLVVAAALALAAGAVNAADAGSQSVPADCAAPPALTAIEPAETRVADRIDHREPVTIVAVGSSSTAGVGASGPGLSYPSRLEAALKERFPGIDFRVINRGKGGEDVTEELARLDRDAIAEHPQLVIWQLGTNAVLHRDDLSADRELIERGVAQLKGSGSDVVLMDLQYAPRVLARPAYEEMEQLIAAVAEHDRIGLFRRFEIMRYWQARQQENAQIVGPDGLHMTDRSYGCLADQLADALARNWRVQKQAAVSRRIAGLGELNPRRGSARRCCAIRQVGRRHGERCDETTR